MRCDLLRGTTLRYTRETKVGIFILTAVAILIFMGCYLGVYRFDSGRYVACTLYFKDINGLTKKAEVKIAGVPVGWVEDLVLDTQHDTCVRADLKIDKACKLYQDAYGVVRQEGLIGPIFLELVPGNPLLPAFSEHVSRSVQPEQVSPEAVMRSLQDVAIEVKGVAQAVKVTLGQAQHIITQVQTHTLPVYTESAQSITQAVARPARFINDACDRISSLYLTYDGHVEDMFSRASFSCFKNAKGTFNVRIYPRPDYFYLVGVTTSQQGYITRTLTVPTYVDDCLNHVCTEADLPEWARYQYIYNQEKRRVKRNAFKVDLQFGTCYKNVALRAGLFEGAAGFAMDVFVPYKGRRTLISTFKMYDFRGQNRLHDERPHCKWINRVFIFDTVYVALGFDDFVSKCNKSFFLGAGFRFGDGDLTYFL